MSQQRDLVSNFVDDLVQEFYKGQIETPKIRNIIGDADTLQRLQKAMRNYVLSLFDGEYKSEYVESRLRIGKVHSRIGVPPKLYVSSMLQLENLLSRYIEENSGRKAPSQTISKFFLFDLQLVFDTYIQGLMSEVELGRDALIEYTDSLEQTIIERTSKIEQLALSDELTGLGNRRSFFKTLTSELKRAQRRSESLSLIFADVDNFKVINDELGHLKGDQILRKVSSIIKSATECHGFRFGGDEFCLILPDSDSLTAQKLAGSIASTISQNKEIPVSVSIGISTATPNDYPSADELISRADSSMYKNKKDKKRDGAETKFGTQKLKLLSDGETMSQDHRRDQIPPNPKALKA